MSEELSVGIGRIGQLFAGPVIRDRAIELELNEFGDPSIHDIVGHGAAPRYWLAPCVGEIARAP